MITGMLVSVGITKSYRDIKLDILRVLPYNFNIKLGLRLKKCLQGSMGMFEEGTRNNTILINK